MRHLYWISTIAICCLYEHCWTRRGVIDMLNATNMLLTGVHIHGECTHALPGCRLTGVHIHGECTHVLPGCRLTGVHIHGECTHVLPGCRLTGVHIHGECTHALPPGRKRPHSIYPQYAMPITVYYLHLVNNSPLLFKCTSVNHYICKFLPPGNTCWAVRSRYAPLGAAMMKWHYRELLRI